MQSFIKTKQKKDPTLHTANNDIFIKKLQKHWQPSKGNALVLLMHLKVLYFQKRFDMSEWWTQKVWRFIFGILPIPLLDILPLKSTLLFKVQFSLSFWEWAPSGGSVRENFTGEILNYKIYIKIEGVEHLLLEFSPVVPNRKRKLIILKHLLWKGKW